MIPISAVESLLPSIKIKSIILADPTQISVSTSAGDKREIIRNPEQLDVRVKVSAITTVDAGDPNKVTAKDFLSIPNFKFHEHLRVAVIQSYNRRTTLFLRSLGDEILDYIGPLNDWRGNDKFDDLYFSTILTKVGVPKSELAAHKSYSLKIQTAKLFEQIDKPILEKIDNDGNKIETIPLDFFFTIPQKRPEHLAYFVLSYIDYDSLIESLNTPSQDEFINFNLNAKDFAQLGNFATPLETDVVFQDSVIANTTYFFKTPDNKVWAGPIHETAAGKYMTGLRPSASSQNLVSFQTQNVKIQDFRNRAAFMSVNVMSDFRDEESMLFESISKFDPSQRVLSPAAKSPHSYISNLFLSVSPDRSVKFMFMVNMDELFTRNSIFSGVVRTQRPSLRKEIISRTKIKSLKIYRQSVEESLGSNSIGGPDTKYRAKNQAPVLIASTHQPKKFSSINQTTDISEEERMSFSQSNIRTFNVVDRNFNLTSNGKYQYTLEIELFDGTVDYFREQLLKLRRFANTLENYSSDMLNSIVRPDEKRDNPYIVDKQVSLSRTREIGGYDFRFDNLTPNFAILMKKKYHTDVKQGINDFIKLMKFFMTSKKFDTASEKRVTNFLGLITNSNTVNPGSVSSILQIVYIAIKKISSFVGENVEMTDPKTRKSESIIGRSNTSDRKVITITKKFNNIADLSMYNAGGYDYLSLNTRESLRGTMSQVGLKFLNGRQYRRRVQSETLRYFVTETPNIARGMTGGTPPEQYGGQDSVMNSALTYFAPSIVQAGIMVDILNGDKIQDNSFMRELETKVSISTMEKKRTGNSPKFRPQFKINAPTTGIAPKEQVSYFAENYSFIATPPKSIPLSDRGSNSPPLPTEEEEGLNSPTPSSAATTPADLYQTLFRRQANKSPMNMGDAYAAASEEDQIGLYNMNNTSNYLQVAPRATVSSLPNQIKALFMTATGNFADVKTRPFDRPNIFKDPNRSSSTTMQYKMLSVVEFLGGFGMSGLSSKRSLLMSDPKWAPLTPAVFSKMIGKNIVCRLRKYEIRGWGLVRPAALDLPTFDEYFILSPDTPITTPQAAVDVSEVVFDAVQDASPAPGFTDIEELYSDMKEFGRSSKPAGGYNLKSNNFKQIVSRLRNLKSKINSDLVADAFNSNRIDIDSEGKRMFAGSGRLPADSIVGKRINSFAKSQVNPSLLRAVNSANPPTAIELKSNFQNFDSVGRLPQLREKLVELRTQASIVREQKRNSQMQIDGYSGKKANEVKSLNKLPNNHPGAKKSRDVMLTRIGKYDNLINNHKKQIQKANTKLKQIVEKERAATISMKKEMAKAQQKVIEGLSAGSKKGEGVNQTRKTENPYSSTKNLQASLDMDLDRISTNERFISSVEVERLSKYKSYMSDSDAKELTSLIDEVKVYSRGDGFSKRPVGKDHRVFGSAGTLIDKSKPKSMYTRPQDLMKSIERKGFNYKGVLGEVATIRDTLEKAGTPQAYVKQTSIDLAKKLVRKSKLDPQSEAIAIEAIIKDVFSDME